jgi:hypothetical protein
MFLQDAFRALLALLQRVIPFDIQSASIARFRHSVVCDAPRCQIDAQSRARYKSQCQRDAPCTRARDVWKRAEEAATKVRKRIGARELGPWNDFAWGMINGKLSALRWVMGEDWDMLHT